MHHCCSRFPGATLHLKGTCHQLPCAAGKCRAGKVTAQNLGHTGRADLGSNRYLFHNTDHSSFCCCYKCLCSACSLYLRENSCPGTQTHLHSDCLSHPVTPVWTIWFYLGGCCNQHTQSPVRVQCLCLCPDPYCSVSWNDVGWKSPPKPLSTTVPRALSRPQLTYVPKCHL